MPQGISEASDFVDNINIPEVANISSVFTYNYFIRDERVSKRPVESSNTREISTIPIDKIARYVTVSWTPPSSVSYQSGTPPSVTDGDIRSAASNGQIVSEDNFFDPGYLNHTFSNVAAIEQGSSDLENYSRLSNDDTESMMQMAHFQIQKIGLGQTSSTQYDLSTKSLQSSAAAYPKLSDSPSKSLGLRVYDSEGNLSDKDDLIRSVSDSLSLRMKLNNAIIPDIFKDPVDLCPTNLRRLAVKFEDNVQGLSYQQRPLNPILVDNPGGEDLGSQASIIGYIIDSYVYEGGDFTKQGTYYISGKNSNSFVDRSVMYGKKYYYTIRTVSSVKLYLYEEGSTLVKRAEVYVSSRTKSTSVDTYEHVPPPEPQSLRFNFDYSNRNLIINWSTPINHQRDIKQYQVFRRRSIKHPFELIAQYGFDDSLTESNGTKYKTSEIVDANNYQNMRTDLKYLVKQKDGILIDNHVDEDFTVDPETYESSEYIYAVCSVDAHGMISNYSTQHRVTFDSRKNRLVTEVICDSGCPRQYPNMKLNTDTFKDTIKVSGDNSRKLDIYFSPEYLKLRSSKGTTFKILEAKTPSQSFRPYYLLQMINLDNQKMQSIRINVDDPEGLTLT
jgi:hypothetical protein